MLKSSKKGRFLECIIVGQGLAGSLLAWEYIQKNVPILVVDSSHKNAASKIAAGIMNPITGKRIVKTWQAETLLPKARTRYQELEQFFEKAFFSDKAMIRLFKDEEEKKVHCKRIEDTSYQPYLGKPIKKEELDSSIRGNLGGFEIKGAGQLNIPLLIESIREELRGSESLAEEAFCHQDLKLEDDHIEWKGIRAKKIIFCEGYQGEKNPWFDWLPFAPAKGEIATFEATKTLPIEIINKGKWILPLKDRHTFRIGATYEWNDLSTEPTDAGRTLLENSTNEMLSGMKGLKCIEHTAGIRPCTKDTYPFIGMHPEHPKVGIFNGFGSKGSLTIPYFAQAFAQEQITPEADIRRYWQK